MGAPHAAATRNKVELIASMDHGSSAVPGERDPGDLMGPSKRELMIRGEDHDISCRRLSCSLLVEVAIDIVRTAGYGASIGREKTTVGNSVIPSSLSSISRICAMDPGGSSASAEPGWSNFHFLRR